MAIATDMKNLGEEIIASYDMRIKAVGGLVKDTHQMLKGFHTEHKEMSAALRAELAKGEENRLKDFKAMMSEIEKFLGDVTKNVSNMIKGFQKDHKAMADELEAGLEKGETERLKDFQKMMSDIQKGIKEIETYVAKKLKEFNKDHADMSEALKKDLAKYVAGIVSETKELLSGFADEKEKMAANWQALTATMAKKREGKPVKVEAAEEVKTVKEAIAGKAQGKKKTSTPQHRTAGSKKSKSRKQPVTAGV